MSPHQEVWWCVWSINGHLWPHKQPRCPNALVCQLGLDEPIPLTSDMSYPIPKIIWYSYGNFIWPFDEIEKYVDAIICTFIYAYDILSLLEVLRHWKGDLVLWFCLAEISCAFTHLPWTKWLPFYTQYFQIHFRNEKFRILIRISLKFVPMGPVDTNSALVLIMAWHRKATSHYLNQCWPDSQKIHAALGGDEFWECLYCG